MINLIPQKEKKELELELIFQKLFSLLLFTFFGFCFLILILAALRVLIINQTGAVEDLVRAKQTELSASDFQEFQETIKETNQYIAQVRNFWQSQFLIAPLLENLSFLKPNSIYFNNLSFTKTYPTNQVSISGFAQTRGALFYFKQNLETESSFDGVYFTPTSWVKPTDVDFSLSFILPGHN